MKTFLPKKFTSVIFITTVLLITLCTLSCKKSIDTQVDPFNFPPDLVTKVTSSVSGFVTDQNNAAVGGADVKVGAANTITDQYGYFEIKNVQVVKEAATVTVSYAGYFKGIKTYIATEGKAAFFRIKLLPKTNAGNINAGTGGSVSLTNGLNISLPANAVKNVATGSAYAGTVNVAAQWIDPTSEELNNIMPGDLRGINSDGDIKALTSYGMMAVELTGSSGELLQVADGKKSVISFPIPASISGSAPATILLWYFDEANGLWKEEGVATKTGNSYVGEVSHFSFWNCDVPNTYVHFDCNLVNASGGPMPFTDVKITNLATGTMRWGYTDNFGYVGGAVPDNANLLLEVYDYWGCSSAIYSQNFSTTNTNISLGTITVNAASSTAVVNGTVTNCSNAPITNGYLMVYQNGWYSRYQVTNTGTFAFNTYLCNGNPTAATLVAEDITSSQQSSPMNITLTAGPVAVGNIQACGISNTQFITYTYGGIAPVEFSSLNIGDTLTYTNGIPMTSRIGGFRIATGDLMNVEFTNTGIAVGSAQNVTDFYSSHIGQTSIPTPFSVNITEYGDVGQFIAGNFTGTVMVTVSSGTYPKNIVCSFRVRRSF